MLPATRRDGAEEDLPISEDDYLTVQHRARRRVLRCPLLDPRHLLWPSPIADELGTLLLHPAAESPNDAHMVSRPLGDTEELHSLQTGQLFHPASNPASRPRTGVSLPGAQTPTRTGLSPASHLQLRSGHIMSSEFPPF